VAARRVFLLYGLSGFVSLGYQVAWFRIFADRFGSTNLTFGLVVVNFIGGLGAGALASQGVAGRLGRALRLRDRLRVYGVVEILVAGSVLLTLLAQHLPADAWGSFPYVLRDGVYAPTRLYQTSQVAIAMFCVFVPCFLMGVTFPLLCHAFLGAPRGSRFPSALYAWNTLGACLGVLACQFVLLPWIGHDRTLWWMAGLNFLLGAFFTATGGAPEVAPPEPSPQTPARNLASEAIPARRVADLGSGVLFTCAVLSGLLAGALEGDMFKRITFNASGSSATMSMISFWAILGIFLASAAVRALPSLKLWHIKAAFVLALVYYAAVWELTRPLIEWLKLRTVTGMLESATDPSLPLAGWGFPSSLGQLLAFVGLSGFPAYLLISLLLPWVCNRIQGDRRHLGVAYGLNTLAFCLGLIGFTLIAPRVNVFYSLKLFMVLLTLGVALLLTISERRRLAPWLPGAALAAFALGCVLTPAGFDATYVSPQSLATRFPVRALRSNAAHTTYVVDKPGDARLFFDNYSMSATGLGAQVYMRLMAHFPLLAQSDPSRALLICFGVGNTASAIAAHETIERIDVVDLNRQVFETAPEFAETNHEVYLDPRVRLIHDDGRSFLRVTDASYDLITSEPPPPMHAGVYRLYSREYYEAALAHLRPAGMMTQWLPVRQMPPEAIDLVISTFVDVFPHTLLFSGFGTDFVLLGSRAPIDLGRLERRFDESASVRADLERLGLEKPLSLLARVVKGDRSLRREWSGRRGISDQHNDLEHQFLEGLQARAISYDPARMLDEIDASRLRSSEELRGVVMHLGRLRYHVRGFPTGSLMTVQASSAEHVALSDVDWLEIDEMRENARKALLANQLLESSRWLRRGLALSDEQPNFLLRLGRVLIALGRHEDAIAPLERFQQIEPEEAIGYRQLGLALLGSGRSEEALGQLRDAMRRHPEGAEAQR
jgi:spermidine synthase